MLRSASETRILGSVGVDDSVTWITIIIKKRDTPIGVD